MTITEVETVQEFDDLQKKVGLLVIHFQAAWAPQCQQVTDALTELAQQPDTRDVVYCCVSAEDLASVSQQLGITAVPTVVVTQTLQAGKAPTVVGRVDGARPADLTSLVRKLVTKSSLTGIGISTPAPAAAASTSPPATFHSKEHLEKLVNSSPVMLFMKGSPDNPKCGFSRTTIELLGRLNAQYSTFDILTDEGIRQGLKQQYQWPTYPQLYVKGELIGGLDILKEMEVSGDLADMLPKKSDLNGRLRTLVRRSPLMVFMKGDPNNPLCGFSRTLVQIMNDTKLPYDTFDILTDEEVRQGLKTFSNWPTYPQVYVDGELVGGLDIIKEMKADDSLMDALKGQQ